MLHNPYHVEEVHTDTGDSGSTDGLDAKGNLPHLAAGTQRGSFPRTLPAEFVTLILRKFCLVNPERGAGLVEQTLESLQ